MSKKENQSDINITGHGNIVGDHSSSKVSIQTGMQTDAIAELIETINGAIAKHPTSNAAEKEELQELFRQIIDEARKPDDEVNQIGLKISLKYLLEMAPDIFDVVVASVSSPVAGISTVLNKIIQKVKDERAAKPGTS